MLIYIRPEIFKSGEQVRENNYWLPSRPICSEIFSWQLYCEYYNNSKRTGI